MALTGNLEAPGGNVKAEAPSLVRLADFICLKQFPGRVEKLLNRHHGITPRLVTTPNWMVYRSIVDQSPYAIKCLYLQGTNPVVTGAQAGEVREALAGLDFLAVSLNSTTSAISGSRTGTSSRGPRRSSPPANPGLTSGF